VCVMRVCNSSLVLTWKSQTVDEILIEGDTLYLKAFEDSSIPEETISLDYLPDHVLFPTITNAKHNHRIDLGQKHLIAYRYYNQSPNEVPTRNNDNVLKLNL